MTAWNHAKVAWLNTQDLPAILRLFIRGGMISTLILLVFTVLPLVPWTVDGKTKTYAEMWRSGDAELAVLWLLVVAAGCWGVALRKPAARWFLIFNPLASIIASIGFAPLRPMDIFSAIVCAVIIYIALFHLRSVRLYFSSAQE